MVIAFQPESVAATHLPANTDGFAISNGARNASPVRQRDIAASFLYHERDSLDNV
jgi:hypothetical protein